MSSYDTWKTASPDDERRTYDCDCCGAATPARLIRQCTSTTGIETFACPACRGEEPYEYDEEFNG